MKTTSHFVASDIAHRFLLGGEIREVTPITQGHINETWLSLVQSGSQCVRYIHQRINPLVFPDGYLVMNNIRLVTDHLRGRATYPYEVLELVSEKGGGYCFRDEEGGWWRTYRYLEDSIAYDTCPTKEVARGAGRAFGDFLREVSGISPSALAIALPGFQDVRGRFRALADVLTDAPALRRHAARDVIESALGSEERVGAVGELMISPELMRVTHGDTKVNNVLFSRDTATALCVIDLDTVMPGSPLYDFGDFTRQLGVVCREDGPADAPLLIQWDFLREATVGFLEGVGRNYLTDRETEALCLMPGLISLTLGVRFLTDYLGGDTYFRTHYEGQNLARARCQIAVAESYFREESRLRDIIGVVGDRLNE